MDTGKVSSWALGPSALKGHIFIVARLLAHIPRLNSVKRVHRNHCLLKNLACRYPYYIGTDDTTTILVDLGSYQNAGKVKQFYATITLGNEQSEIFEACLSNRVEPRHQPDIHRWESGGSGCRNQSILCARREGSHPPPLEANRKSIRGRKPEDPTYLVETARESTLPGQQGVKASPPKPDKEEAK